MSRGLGWKSSVEDSVMQRKALRTTLGDILSIGKRNILKGVAGLAVVGTLFGYATCTKYVGPDEFGVMQVDYSPAGMLGKQGIQEGLYDTGIHLQIPGFQKIHTFPKKLQVLTLKANRSKEGLEERASSRYVRFENPAHIQTSDGYFIDLDVSIIYKITDPYKVITTIGAGKLYEDNGIVPVAEPILKETLGKLRPEDFFRSELRLKKQIEAREALNSSLNPKGLAVDHVLVRYPNYHPDVQQKIENRNIEEQQKEKNKTLALESEATARLQKITEEGKANVSIILTNGYTYVSRREAEMQAYDRVKRSDADKLTKLAEAEKTRLINGAYQGTGAERLVGMEVADILKGLDTIIIPVGGANGMNLLDIDATMRKLQIGSEAKK